MSYSLPLACVTLLSAALLSAVIIAALLPLLRRHMVATPNTRSSHRAPTPQGGGVAVIGAALAVSFAALTIASGGMSPQLWALFAATITIAMVGGADDMFVLEAVPRLLLQALCEAVVTAAIPGELRV